MTKLLWIISMISALISGVVFSFGVMRANGAPQEAAACAIALCIVIGPYLLARAATELAAFKSTPRRLDRATEKVETVSAAGIVLEEKGVSSDLGG